MTSAEDRPTSGADPVVPSDAAPECSAKGCRQRATWQVRWNNPRLHTPERRKIWLACDEHRQSLADFLTARSFLRDVVAFPAGGADAG